MPALPKCSTCGTKAKYYGEFAAGADCPACFSAKEVEEQNKLTHD